MKTEINKVVGTGLLVCDHCRHFRKDMTKKQCEKIVYNKFGNVVFICEPCKKRA